MKNLEFESALDSRKKLMTILFWINRKAARTEGCAPFLLKKIVTEENTYTPEDPKLLKLTNAIIEDILESMDENKHVKFEISMGNEYITTEIDENILSVNTVHNIEIEDEIIEKLDQELNKKYPSICESFKPRVTPKR